MSAWDALRDCWLALGRVKDSMFEDISFLDELHPRHATALDELVASGELERAVADEIGVAFEQEIAHIQKQQSMCYIALPSEHLPRQDLLQQSAALEQMAAVSRIDPETVAQARAALGRDIAWLARFAAGEVPGNLFTIEVTPQAAEAARILAQLFLGQQP